MLPPAAALPPGAGELPLRAYSAVASSSRLAVASANPAGALPLAVLAADCRLSCSPGHFLSSEAAQRTASLCVPARRGMGACRRPPPPPPPRRGARCQHLVIAWAGEFAERTRSPVLLTVAARGSCSDAGLVVCSVRLLRATRPPSLRGSVPEGGRRGLERSSGRAAAPCQPAPAAARRGVQGRSPDLQRLETE
ncbi:unnamed protein product, partial [Prorocentrum cordatum]